MDRLGTVEIGDTFEREGLPGFAWEVTERYGDCHVLRFGRWWVAYTREQILRGPWRRCDVLDGVPAAPVAEVA
jgi:hypothetical protein